MLVHEKSLLNIINFTLDVRDGKEPSMLGFGSVRATFGRLAVAQKCTPVCAILKSKIQNFSLYAGPATMFFPGPAVYLDVSWRGLSQSQHKFGYTVPIPKVQPNN